MNASSRHFQKRHTEQKAAHRIIENGKSVKINNGLGAYSTGVVIGYSTKANKLGWAGNYTIQITGDINCFGDPEKVGNIVSVLFEHVSEIDA